MSSPDIRPQSTASKIILTVAAPRPQLISTSELSVIPMKNTPINGIAPMIQMMKILAIDLSNEL